MPALGQVQRTQCSRWHQCVLLGSYFCWLSPVVHVVWSLVKSVSHMADSPATVITISLAIGNKESEHDNLMAKIDLLYKFMCNSYTDFFRHLQTYFLVYNFYSYILYIIIKDKYNHNSYILTHCMYSSNRFSEMKTNILLREVSFSTHNLSPTKDRSNFYA